MNNLENNLDSYCEFFAFTIVDLFDGNSVELLLRQLEGHRNCSSMMVKSLDNDY